LRTHHRSREASTCSPDGAQRNPGRALPLTPLRSEHTSSFSRVVRPPSFANSSLTPREGAERRQALGCSGTRRRASDAGPQASADALHPTQTSLRRLRLRGCSPLGAPPRRFVGPVPRGMKQEGFTVCELHSASKTRVNALIASARSGGGRVSGASRELACICKHAGRRIPLCHRNASREHP